MNIKERHIFAGVLLGTVLILALAMLIPSNLDQVGSHLPWQIELDHQGRTQVFGTTLGKSPMGELEQRIGEPVVLSLFAHDDGKRVVEGFFDNVGLGGLRAKMVVVLDYSEDELEAMYQRGVRKATTGSRIRKVTLSSADQAAAREAVVNSITYLPRSRLNPELVESRFGQPEERIALPGSESEHWLYPQLGLDIALNERGSDVLQYVLPEHFDALRGPLLEQGELIRD